MNDFLPFLGGTAGIVAAGVLGMKTNRVNTSSNSNRVADIAGCRAVAAKAIADASLRIRKNSVGH